MYTIEQIKKDLKNNLSEFRYEHSILVAEESKKLASHYKLDEEKAYIAGLVHDIAKEFDDEENAKWIKKYNLLGDIFSPEYKNVIHSFIGAVVIKEWYGMDEEICNAVKYHTIGNMPMTTLDKVVFIADKIARKVSNPIIDEERNLAYQNIDKALEFYLKTQKNKLESLGKKMYPTTLNLLEYLNNKNSSDIVEQTKKDIQVLWDYLCLNTKNKRSECIIGLGSILTKIPKKCAELYRQGLGEYIVFSGNCGKGTEGVITRTEAEIFRDIAIEEGVPANRIYIETNATSTYENYKYIKRLLVDNNLNPKTFLIVGKPYQEKRASAIADIELSDKDFTVSSFNMTFEDYFEYVISNNLSTEEDIINELIGEISLIMLTPKYGLQSHQKIPDKVIESYNKLVSLGFTKYVYNDEIINNHKEKMIENGLY